MKIIWVECVKCGKVFDYQYRGSGKKPQYCEECRLEMLKEHQRNYYDKKKSQAEEEQQKEVLTENTTIEVYVERAITLCENLDHVRIEMCKLCKELSEYQSSYDKLDQEFIHKIEANSFTDADEALQFVTDWHNDRKSRRGVKNIMNLLKTTIEVIPMKNKYTAIGVLKFGRTIDDTRRTDLRVEEREQ